MLLKKNYYKPNKISFRDTLDYLDKDIVTRLAFLDKKITLGNKMSSLFSPNIIAILNYRLGHYFLYRKLGFIKLRFISKILTFINLILFSCEIFPFSEIGPGFFLAHSVSVAIAAKIGKNVRIYGQSGIGGRGDKVYKGWAGGPIIGDNVMIGRGANVLGPLEIGDNVVVKAMTLVTDSVPANSVVGGNPAKVSPNKSLNKNVYRTKPLP